MTVRDFRRMPRARRMEIASGVKDPLARRVLLFAFCGRAHKSWEQAALFIGGGNTPDSVRMLAARALAALDDPQKN